MSSLLSFVPDSVQYGLSIFMCPFADTLVIVTLVVTLGLLASDCYSYTTHKKGQ